MASSSWSMPSNASLASAVKAAGPVTYEESPPASGSGTSARSAATSETTCAVFSFVVSTVTSSVDPSSETIGGPVSGSRPAPISPQAMPYGVTMDLRSGIAFESHSDRASAAIRWLSASVSPPVRW